MKWNRFISFYNSWASNGDQFCGNDHQSKLYLLDKRCNICYPVIAFFRSGLMRCDGKYMYQLVVSNVRFRPMVMIINVYSQNDLYTYELKRTEVVHNVIA